MTKSRTELMVDRLRDLRASSPDVEASAVVSVDGLTMASALPEDVEEDRVSAMSAAMLSSGNASLPRWVAVISIKFIFEDQPDT